MDRDAARSSSSLSPEHGRPAQRSSSAAPAAHAPIRRRNRMITSCLECRRRKLKCDKSHPCANCTRFSRDCVFLAPALDSASQLKLTQIKEQMGSLERVLEEDVARKNAARLAGNVLPEEGAVEGETAEPYDEKDLEPSPMAVVDATYDDDADDDLLDLGIKMGRMRITERIGGFVRPKMSEELDATLEDVARSQGSSRSSVSASQSPKSPPPDPNDFLQPGPTYIVPSATFFFGTGAGQSSLIDFLPSKTAADRLVEQYFKSVYPLARCLHRPTFERQYELFWNDVSRNIEPPSSVQAIVFSVMFSGVVSMSDEDAQSFLVEKRVLVDNYRLGTEAALTRANFLRTTKLETFQAFVMYLIPLCRDQISRSHAALVGTAIRLAQCMGLHRDPTNYQMPPIETHVRRLIWYQLCFLDIRTCEGQGPRPTLRRDDFDTQFPLNVDDNDFLTSKPPNISSDSFTDMTITLIRFECNEMHRIVWFDRPRIEQKKISITALLAKIEGFRKAMDAKYLHLFNLKDPIQHYARLLMRMQINRMHIMVLHRYHVSVNVRIPDRLRQVTLTSGTRVTEDAITLESLQEFSPWWWYCGAYQQWHTAFLLLVEIFMYPMRRESDRIWRCLDYVFEIEPSLPSREKGRLILKEMTEKTRIYQDMRKMRAPTRLEVAMKERPLGKGAEPGQMGSESSPEHEVHPLDQSSNQTSSFPEAVPSNYAQASSTSGHMPPPPPPAPEAYYTPLTSTSFNQPSLQQPIEQQSQFHQQSPQAPADSSYESLSFSAPTNFYPNPPGLSYKVPGAPYQGVHNVEGYNVASQMPSSSQRSRSGSNRTAAPPQAPPPMHMGPFSQPDLISQIQSAPVTTAGSYGGMTQSWTTGTGEVQGTAGYGNASIPGLYPTSSGPMQQPVQAQSQAQQQAGHQGQHSGGIPATSGIPGGSTGAPVEEMSIDWSEWDKLFPPDINTGDLNAPMQGLA